MHIYVLLPSNYSICDAIGTALTDRQSRPRFLNLFQPSAQLVLLVYMHSLGVDIWLPAGNQTIR